VRVDRNIAKLNLSERVTVGLRFRDRIGANVSARTRTVFDDEALAKGLSQMISGDTRGHIHEATRRRVHDQSHRLRRIVLSGHRQCVQDNDQRDE
jgi:hypothetical protein